MTIIPDLDSVPICSSTMYFGVNNCAVNWCVLITAEENMSRIDEILLVVFPAGTGNTFLRLSFVPNTAQYMALICLGTGNQHLDKIAGQAPTPSYLTSLL